MFQTDRWNTETSNARIQSLAVARVIPSCAKFTNSARQYQPFAFGNSRPGKDLSRIKKPIVATITSRLGRVMVMAPYDVVAQRALSALPTAVPDSLSATV